MLILLFLCFFCGLFRLLLCCAHILVLVFRRYTHEGRIMVGGQARMGTDPHFQPLAGGRLQKYK